jgi:hypothetical protein
VKLKWGLTADPAEIAALRQILGTEAEMPILAEECAGTMTSGELPAAQVDCQAKRYCTQMKTCEEARAYLTQCETRVWIGMGMVCLVRPCATNQDGESYTSVKVLMV